MEGAAQDGYLGLRPGATSPSLGAAAQAPLIVQDAQQESQGRGDQRVTGPLRPQFDPAHPVDWPAQPHPEKREEAKKRNYGRVLHIVTIPRRPRREAHEVGALPPHPLSLDFGFLGIPCELATKPAALRLSRIYHRCALGRSAHHDCGVSPALYPSAPRTAAISTIGRRKPPRCYALMPGKHQNKKPG